MAAKVFISYRRDDSAGYAGRVRDRLERELGPNLLGGARIPKADQLPEGLKELALRNGMEIRHASFQDDMNRLIRGLKGDGVYLAGEGASEFSKKTHVAQKGLWGFLRDKHNQQVLGWLGGGLVVAATGLWVA